MDPADDPSIQFTGTDTGPPTRRREADSGLGMSVGGNVLEEIIGEDVVLGQEGEVENLQREEEERQGVNLNPLGEEAMLLLAPDNERNEGVLGMILEESQSETSTSSHRSDVSGSTPSLHSEGTGSTDSDLNEPDAFTRIHPSMLKNLPRFDGRGRCAESAQMLISYLDWMSEAQMWTNEDKALILKLRLSGIAARWLKGLATIGVNVGIYLSIPGSPGLRDLFLNRFGQGFTENQAVRALDDLQQKEDEEVLSFLDRVTKAHVLRTSFFPITERQREDFQERISKEIKMWFVAGLKPSLKKKIIGQTPPSLSDIMSVLTTVEEEENDKKRKKKHKPEGEDKEVRDEKKKKKRCLHCRMNNHTSEKCRKRKFINSTAPKDIRIGGSSSPPNEKRDKK